jgi:hypothetical protein
MTFPTIHMNGTSARSLAEDYSTAGRAVGAACEALAKAGPNGRDYYPQGAEAMKAATSEHCARMERLRAVKAELLALLEYCMDQIK